MNNRNATDQEKILFRMIITQWNTTVKGKYKTVRLEEPFIETNSKKIAKALAILPNISMWQIAFNEALKNLEDDDSQFWANAAPRLGLAWMLQRSSKGQGELNYVKYYEIGMDRKEKTERKMEVFEFEPTNIEELP